MIKWTIVMLVFTGCVITAFGQVPKSKESFLYQADPTIFYDNGLYYLYGTHEAAKGFEAFVSQDLVHWRGPAGKDSGFVLKKGDAYGNGGFWAPQVLRYRKNYYIAYAADEHVAIARSQSPLGPFTQTEKRPLLQQKAIDPFLLMTEGKIYLYYVKLSEGNRIFVCELNEDLSAIIPGTEKSCVNAVADPQPWENTAAQPWTVTEGPTVLKHRGWYYLFYSANDFRNSDYAVGYAVSRNPLGPWKKFAGNPILNTNLIGKKGPGHGDFFRDGSGTWYYVFHTHNSDTAVAPRKTALIKGAFIPASGPDQMVLKAGSFHYLHASAP